MLKQRTITALVLFLIAYLVLFHTPPAWFAVGCWSLCLIAMYELTTMYHFNRWQKLLLLGFTTALVASLQFINYDISQIIRIVTVITWCFVVPLILIFLPSRFSKITIAALSIIVFIPAYYALTVIHALFGPWQLVSIMAIAWVADTGAYFIGRKFGRRKLAKAISPGKSIEGAIGGIVLVCFYLFILHHFNAAVYLPDLRNVLKFGLIVTCVSIIGDLFESWLKRVAAVKDSSNLLPGHGGVFDRIDSLIAVLAIAFAIIRGMI
jgi:phosphatidate cytidylyltransferase